MKFLLEQKIGTHSQQKWISKLLGYDIVVKFKCEKENKVAYALSRMEKWVEEADWAQFIAITLAVATWLEDFKSSYHNDIEIQAILEALETEPKKKRLYKLKERILLYKEKNFISQQCSLKRQIL